MRGRLGLHNVLIDVMGTRGQKPTRVYFQPPESVKLSYPAIVYSRTTIGSTFADNEVYMQSHGYQITVIDEDPDSEIVKKVSRLPTCRFDRHFTADNLNHDVFKIYY